MVPRRETAELLRLAPVENATAFDDLALNKQRTNELLNGERDLIESWHGPGVLLVVSHSSNIKALTDIDLEEGAWSLLARSTVGFSLSHLVRLHECGARQTTPEQHFSGTERKSGFYQVRTITQFPPWLINKRRLPRGARPHRSGSSLSGAGRALTALKEHSHNFDRGACPAEQITLHLNATDGL